MPSLRLLADRVASRLRAKYRLGRTVTVRGASATFAGHTLGNAGCADFGDRSPAEIGGGVSAQALCSTLMRKMISLVADLRCKSFRSCGTCSLNSPLGGSRR